MKRVFSGLGLALVLAILAGCGSPRTSGREPAGASFDSPEEMTGSGTSEFLGYPNYPQWQR
ncbi:MAG TPA: hypothetical protein VN673_07670 [Clostridia bacterium]|nr:hypothetical protein [Clostridia bacterium]